MGTARPTDLTTGVAVGNAEPSTGAPAPTGPEQLAAQLRALGLSAGQDVLVHCSLRRLGLARAGAATLAEAIQAVLGPGGTLVVPTHTSGNSTTSRAWHAATRGMTPEQRRRHEATLPGWDRVRTPAQGMGAFAEHVRRLPGAFRSDHPQTSFAAVGRRAAALTADHDLRCHLGERSPLGRMYDLGGLTLLLGVGYEACTALHLAEYRLPAPPPQQSYRCYQQIDGRRVRLEFRAPDLDDGDFPALGARLDGQPFVRRGTVARATARLLPIPATVDLAVQWFVGNRISPRH